MSTAEANITILIGCYERGLDTAEACAISKVSRRSVDVWLSSPSNDTQRSNAERIREAQSQYAADTIAAVTASHASDWRAAAWTLEHSPATRLRYAPKVDADAATASVQVLAALASSFAARAALPVAPPVQLLAESEDVLSD